MTYYDALVAKWATLTGTTAEKLAQVNTLTVAGQAIPMVIPTHMIYNSIDIAEFNALTEPNKQLVRDILSMGTVDACPDTQVRAQIVALFPSGNTITKLATLAAKYDTPQVLWWQSAGYSSPISSNDLSAAGIS